MIKFNREAEVEVTVRASNHDFIEKREMTIFRDDNSVMLRVYTIATKPAVSFLIEFTDEDFAAVADFMRPDA